MMKRLIFPIVVFVVATLSASAQIEETPTDTIGGQELQVTDWPGYFFMPAVFDHFTIYVPQPKFSLDQAVKERSEITGWVDEVVENNERMSRLKLDYMIANPQYVKYNEQWLPEPPKEYRAVVDPSSMKITVEEITVTKDEIVADVPDLEVKRTNWIHGFNGSVQFSQAYISPNWYQGGNNNLNMLVNALYNIKLNPAYYPNLMFETSIQYKLGLNSAPDDTIRSYSISEDILQVNSKFGVRAAKRWFYSIAAQLRTPLFNGYKSNTNDLTAALFSMGELNVGLGMTYNYLSDDKKLQFDASISPLSYNLKTCINSRMNPTAFGIKPGRKAISQYGSSGEAKLAWALTHNITWNSRVFVFTDYEYVQGDWENTFSFAINRFISTQIYAHLRYDSSTGRMPGSKWHHWQFKEILSFGFAYKFGII